MRCSIRMSLVVASGAILASVAIAGTVYDDGNNPNCPGDGSAHNPFCLIQDGVNAAQDGDLVLGAPGAYLENVVFAGRAITLRSQSGPEVTTVDSGGIASAIALVKREGPGTVIEGFTVLAGHGSPVPPHWAYAGG